MQTMLQYKSNGECKNETVSTESELIKDYENIQGSISTVSKDIYNGMYNGNYSLDEALTILENSKKVLTELLQQYTSLPKEQKADRHDLQ